MIVLEMKMDIDLIIKGNKNQVIYKFFKLLLRI